MDDFGALVVVLLCLLVPACMANNAQKSKWEEDCKTIGVHRTQHYFRADVIYECKERK